MFSGRRWYRFGATQSGILHIVASWRPQCLRPVRAPSRPSRSIVDDTYGFGVGLQYRGIVGARYDWAEVPQAPFLREVHREGFTIWFDPVRFVRASDGGERMVASR